MEFATVLTQLEQFKRTGEICGIKIFEKNVKEKDIFVCIKGINQDGHNYAKAAIEKGAVFIIAEKDLQIRGPGEYLGVRQSGLPALSIADLTRDLPILEIARKDVFELIENNNEVNQEYLKKLISNFTNILKKI